MNAHTHTNPALRLLAAPLALAVIGVLALCAPAAIAQSGGVGTGGTGDGGGGKTVAGSKAKLKANGRAVPPENAPPRVKRVIRAANQIVGKGYCYGGGHASFNSRCYDCSGAASYALKGGNFVSSPMPSGGYFRWGKKGRGKWITVYTHSGHMYITVAGLRFDTGMVSGTAPRWSNQMRSAKGFRKRHHPKF